MCESLISYTRIITPRRGIIASHNEPMVRPTLRWREPNSNHRSGLGERRSETSRRRSGRGGAL